jgi:tripartite-type tricarboxylate transporter receptor subunit TctC
MDRRTFALLAGSLALEPRAWAAEPLYPQRVITIVVPFSAGSVVDVQARVIAKGLAARLGQAVIVDNRVGVAGSLGAEAVARAAPDGYTLLIGTQGTHGTNTVLYRNIRYDPVKDFVAVHGLLGNANVLVVNPAAKLRDVNALIERGKAEPGKVSFGSGGTGTSSHLCLELLQSTTGARFTHIPYKSGTAALVDLISGNIEAMFDFAVTSAPHVRSGKIVPMAVTSTKRLSALPDVPTMTEAGYPAVEALSWGGLFAPARTPPAVVKRLSDELGVVMKSPEVKAALDAAASFPIDMPHEAFQAYVAAEAGKWAEVVRRSGAKLE